jgi:lysine 2,3-aminomutase
MEKWKKIFSNSITDAQELKRLFKIDEEEINKIIERYPMRINPYYFSLIKAKGDPIWKQCIPHPKEIRDQREDADPLLEELYSPIFGLVHRYHDRVLLLVSNMCATYCRFCTRKRKVGKEYKTLKDEDFQKAIKYIKTHKEIRDVIISGGDPLLLENKRLEAYIKRIRNIKHVEIIRIDSRTPCTLPQRITPRLCNMLKKYSPIYFLTHFNHPNEITKEAKIACEMLADSGMVMGNQSVLLKGVNDNPWVLKQLGEELLKIKVRPYYIFIPDAVMGTRHFRVPIRRATKIMRGVIGHTSGLAIPKLIIDLENGGGKIPLSPIYIKKKEGKKYTFRNFEGKLFPYTDV